MFRNSDRPETPCIEWTGALGKDGYGRRTVKVADGVFLSKRVHRLVWVEAHGEIPEGLVVHHRCENRICYNVSHLELVTTRENVLMGTGHAAENARKTHCLRGHEFTPENTYTPPGTRARICRKCNAFRQRGYNKRKREKEIQSQTR